MPRPNAVPDVALDREPDARHSAQVPRSLESSAEPVLGARRDPPQARIGRSAHQDPLDLSSVPALGYELADLDQVPVGVSHVTADLAAVIDRRCEELRASLSPFVVHGVNVGDPNVQKA